MVAVSAAFLPSQFSSKLAELDRKSSKLAYHDRKALKLALSFFHSTESNPWYGMEMFLKIKSPRIKTERVFC
jgi:hypothetical protein